jgi:hypothetical protein
LWIILCQGLNSELTATDLALGFAKCQGKSSKNSRFWLTWPDHKSAGAMKYHEKADSPSISSR